MIESKNQKLVKAMADIEKIVKDNDLIGFIILCGETHTEYKGILNPSWSTLGIEGNGITFHYRKDRPEDCANTLGAIKLLSSLCGRTFLDLNSVCEQVEKQMEVKYNVAPTTSNLGGGIEEGKAKNIIPLPIKGKQEKTN